MGTPAFHDCRIGLPLQVTSIAQTRVIVFAAGVLRKCHDRTLAANTLGRIDLDQDKNGSGNFEVEFATHC
jgi:hypothetical protein